MTVFASAAVTSDGALNDCSGKRLCISSREDWAEVQRLRAQFDAILVGAGTVRSDDPRLVIADEALRTRRAARGMSPDLVKVTFTRSGHIDPAARFFTCGTGRKIVFSPRPLPHLDGLAEVIVEEHITAACMVTELEKRGIGSLFVEGGAETLKLFFGENMVDTFRLAVNPALTVADTCAPRLGIPDACRTVPHRTERFGTTEVRTYELRKGVTDEDIRYLQMAVSLSRNCVPCAGSYRVGAVVVARSGEVFTGYTHETSPTHHAEQEAVAKAREAGADLHGAAIYSSMEPCSVRKSEPESCSAMILRLGFSRVIFAAYEPDCFVECTGALTLRTGGVEVRTIPAFAEDVRKINSHIER